MSDVKRNMLNMEGMFRLHNFLTTNEPTFLDRKVSLEQAAFLATEALGFTVTAPNIKSVVNSSPEPFKWKGETKKHAGKVYMKEIKSDLFILANDICRICNKLGIKPLERTATIADYNPPTKTQHSGE